MIRTLKIEPLDAGAFAPFGGVVETDGARRIAINQGFAERFDDLAQVDVLTEGGAINVSVIAGTARPRPIALALMERHPLGSQMFFPLQDRPWLVVVCGDPRDRGSFRAFRASGRQGVNYARNVWHHPLLTIDAAGSFLVVDRKGPGNNLEEIRIDGREIFHLEP